MRRVTRSLAMMLIVLAMITARVIWSSRVALDSAHEAQGEERVIRLGLAARLYAPGNPYSRRALAELREIAIADDALALESWQNIRSSILATRSFYTPHRALLDEANAQIAERMAHSESPPNARLFERTRAWHAARLAQDDAPSVGWTMVALIGFGGWLSAAILFCLRGLDENEKLRRKTALACAAFIAVGLCLFFIGLARA